jgi:2-methylaconitate cis-trans-isomerase PrpF
MKPCRICKTKFDGGCRMIVQAAERLGVPALGVESRAEIDADEDVAADFHRDIRRPYVEWQRARGVAL